jgi:hypothetical protein
MGRVAYWKTKGSFRHSRKTWSQKPHKNLHEGWTKKKPISIETIEIEKKRKIKMTFGQNI